MNVNISTISPARLAPQAVAAAIGRIVTRIASRSEAMRCSREAARLLSLSDAELSRRGLVRDRVVQHAFARFLAS